MYRIIGEARVENSFDEVLAEVVHAADQAHVGHDTPIGLVIGDRIVVLGSNFQLLARRTFCISTAGFEVYGGS